MPDLTDRYTRYSIYKMFVDSLKEDGAICDYYSKYYDENETYKGGTNSRRAFTEYNNKIIQYHNILKVLTGEQRANIYEQIPAIDMFDLSNSSLMSTYKTTGDKNNPIDPTTIVSIDTSSVRSALDLIESGDKATINRAVMGESMAEHFYNTTGMTFSDYNIQVSPWEGDFAYIYNGIISPKVMIPNPEVDGGYEKVSGIRKTSLLVYKVNSSVRVPCNPMKTSGMETGKYKVIKGNKYSVDSNNFNTILLNTDCEFPHGPTYPIKFPITEGNKGGENVIEEKDKAYYLNLKAGDYVVAIPSTSYSSEVTKVLIFKSSFDRSGDYVDIEDEAVEAWLSPNGKFYKDKDYSDPIVPSVSTYYLDGGEKERNGRYVYYRYQREVDSYFECTGVTNVSKDTEDTSGINISIRVSYPHYQSFILYISDFSSGLSSAATFEEIEPGDNLKTIISQEDIISTLTDYISINKEFYSNASGLLDGYYCEPCQWTEATSNSPRTVTKWKFCNDSVKVKLKDVAIDVGSKYFPGHLLERGNMLASPLKLTKSDYLDYRGDETHPSGKYYAACSGNTPTLESIGINGKATLLYKKIDSESLLAEVMQGSKVENWTEFSAHKLKSVITKSDYSEKNSDKNKGMLYPFKFFTKDNPNNPITFGEINKYIDRFEGCIEPGDPITIEKEWIENEDGERELVEIEKGGDILVLDSNNNYTKISYSISINDRGSSDAEKSPRVSTPDINKDSNISILKTDFDVSFVASYNAHYKSDGTTFDTRIENLQVSVITPRELFTKEKDSSDLDDVDTILVFPEYKEYFPSGAILLSKEDLKLDVYTEDANDPKRGIVSFITNKAYDNEDSVLLFKVDRKQELKFSNIRYVRISDDLDNHQPTKVKINNCCQEPGVYLCGRKDHAGRGKDDESAASKEARNRFKDFKNKRDCYVYFLSALPINFNDKIDVYDINDKKINLDNFGGGVGLLAASYPNNYFPIRVARATDGGLYYEIEENYRSSSYETLKDSIIVPGLPKFSSLEDLSNIRKDGFDLSSIANFLRNSNIGSLAKRVFNNIFYDWPLSDSLKNPLLMGDSMHLVEGLVDFANAINDFSESEFEIIENGELVKIQKSKLNKLISRINSEDTESDRYYEFTQKYSPIDYSSVDFSSGTWPNDMLKTMRERINYKEVSGDYTGIKTRILPEDSELVDKRRLSLIEMANSLKGIIEGSTDFKEEDCKNLDSTFGNNTKAFIDIGDEIEDSERISFRNSSLSNAVSEYYDLITDTLTKTLNEYLGKKYEYSKIGLKGILASNYRNLYTVESVERCIKLINGNLEIDYEGLEWDFGADAGDDIIWDLNYNEYRLPILLLQDIYKEGPQRKTSGGTSFSDMIRKMKDNILGNWDPNNSDGFDDWMKKYVLDPDLLREERLSEKAKPYINRYNKEYKEAVAELGAGVTEEDVLSYLRGTSDQWTTDDNIRVVPSANNKYTFIVGLPTVKLGDGGDVSIDENGKVILVPAGGRPLSSYLANQEHPDNMRTIWAWSRAKRIINKPDVSADVLRGMASYVKSALEGTPIGYSDPYVKYVAGEDTLTDGKPRGREDSLYFKRYQMLNNRMNRLKGPLWQAASYLRNSTVFDDVQNFSSQVLDSYDPFISVVPIESMESMTYMPKQEATLSTIELPGKFYSDKELEAMRASINSKCVLTCTSCSIKDSCPFYDENEVIKMYCTGIETIDFWVKDNELDLLDEIKVASPDGEGFSLEEYKAYHKPYSDVLKKVKSDSEIDTYEVNDLNRIRKQLSEAENLKYSDYVKDDMGWLNHARYGTIEKNSIKDLLDENVDSEFYSLRDRIHPYRYMYDALFIADEESYIRYTLSNRAYNVSFEKGKPGDKKLFTGTVKVKIPVSLKAFDDADDEDDVYLISDDTKDADGSDIVPVIYLGKAKNIQWTFDLVDDGLGDNVNDSEVRGSLSPDDPNIYAADVAQWCINYYKGNCADNPIGDISNGIPDNFTNRDQYWMENVYKKVYDQETGTYKWYQFPGRKRVSSGYSEPLIDSENFDDIQAVSGRPMIANYVNFVRKVSIRIYNNDEPDETKRWTIPWVNPNLPLLNGASLDAEKQRSVLPMMKTNLRLAIVKSGKE